MAVLIEKKIVMTCLNNLNKYCSLNTLKSVINMTGFVLDSHSVSEDEKASWPVVLSQLPAPHLQPHLPPPLQVSALLVSMLKNSILSIF